MPLASENRHSGRSEAESRNPEALKQLDSRFRGNDEKGGDTPFPGSRRVFPQQSASIEARQAALMELRIGDRAALYSHPLPAEGGVCG